MKEQECKSCGKKFMAYECNHRLYCSKECASKTNWEKREKAKKVKLICWNCKKEFQLN